MSTIRIRIAGFITASALVLGLGTLGAGPAQASSHHGIHAVATEADASLNGQITSI